MRFMRKRPETAKQEDAAANDERVRLPSLLGIRPGVYLSVLYGLVLLGILFFLCLFPGLSRPGTLVSFVSEPEGAAIRVDGITRGAAPEKLFLDRGSHRVEFVLPGFETRDLELEVPGRAAFSLFFPRRLELKQVLTTADPLAVLAAAASDYAAWSFTGEATASYQIPLSLSEGVYRAGPLPEDRRGEAAELIRAAARFTVSQASLRDLVRAKLLLDNGGFVPSVSSLGRSAVDIVSWLSSAPGAALWLEELLPAEAAGTLRDSAWARDTEEVPAAPVEPAERAGGPMPEIAGFRFLPVSGAGGTFYYAEEPLGAASWEVFLEARPEWGYENLEILREQKLVNGDYLLARDSEKSGPQTAVSWYAARAFCHWLSGRLPAGFEGWEVRLPREEEWDACFSAAPSSGTGGAGLWEWCEDPYAPLNRFPAEREAVEFLSSPERLLRNGRRPDARGSLPPDLCSPFAGFRPFLVPQAASRE
jgi:hypothetical protein